MPRYAVQVTRTEWTSTVVFVEADSVEDAEEQAENDFDEECGFDMDIDDSETEFQAVLAREGQGKYDPFEGE